MQIINTLLNVCIIIDGKHGVKRGSWCPTCNGKTPNQSRQKFEEVVKMKGGLPLEEYKGNKVKLTIQCLNGHHWSVRPNDIKNG